MNATPRDVTHDALPGVSSRIRVLLVDDSRAFLDALGRLLEQEKRIEVVGRAHSGEEAIALARDLAPDLILMDIAMPGMSGLAATVVIKARVRAPRVVIVTVNEAPEYQAAARGVGADGFVTKGEIGAELFSVVRALFPPGEPGEARPGTGE